jgi:hypothetical protein
MAFDVQKTKIEITATDKTGAAFNAVKSSLTGLTAQFGALGGLLGAGAFAAMTKRIIDQADSMNDLSQRTGIAVGQLNAWKLATEQSGTSMEALTAALGKGSKYLVQHGDDLKKIGINAKTSEELILQLSGIISKMPSDDPRRVALAMQVLGKSAGELIPLLSAGEAELRKQLETGEKWNKLTPEMAKNADEFNDKLAELQFRASNIGTSIVSDMLPPMTRLLEIIERGTEKTSTFTDKLKAIGLFLGPSFAIPALREAFTETPEQRGIAQSGKIRKASPKVIDDKALKDFLDKPDIGMPKKDAIAERIKALGVENTLLAQGVSIEDARTIARLKGDGATDQQIVKILNLTNAQTQYEEAEKKAEKTKQDLVKATQDHADAMQKMLETSDLAVLNAEREYEESQRNLQVMQLGETAVIRMESARLLEAAASAEQGLAYARLNGLSQENIDFTETQILRLKQLAEARLKFANSQDSNAAFEKEKDRIKDLEKEQKDAAKRVAEEQKRFADDINRSLTDALLRGFESGKGFARNFRDTLKNMFQTLVLRPAINFALNSTGITGALGGLSSIFSGAAQAAGPIGGGFGGGLGSLSGIADIFQRGNSALVSGIESLGTFLSTGNGGLGDILGGALGQYSNQIANVLPFAGVGLNLLQGNVKGAIGAGIGAALSLTPLGPVGGLIGSIVGGSLFGGKKQPPRTVTQLPEVNEQFINTLTALTKGFGLDSNITASARYSGRGGGSGYGFFDANVNGVKLNEGIRYKDAYGEATMKQFIETVLVGNVKKAVEKINLPEGIKKFFTELTKQEEIAATINGVVSLNAQLKTLPPVFDAIRKALNTTDFNIGIAEVQKQFSDTSTFTSLFYTQQEQFKIFTDQLTAQLKDINQVVPKTRDEYRKIVDSFKVTDEASSKLFGGLVALAPAMDAYFKQLEVQQGLFQALNTDLFSTSADYLAASALSGNGKDFTNQIGELSTVRKKADAESNAVVKALVDAQAETKAILEAVAVAVQETARLQKIWNGDGLPETRVV